MMVGPSGSLGAVLEPGCFSSCSLSRAMLARASGTDPRMTWRSCTAWAIVSKLGVSFSILLTRVLTSRS